MAIDYGDARTGVAVSDASGLLAGYTGVITVRGREALVAELSRLAQQREVTELVVGLPRNMDGSEGPRAALCRQLGEELAACTGLPVSLWDERRSTIEAHQILHAVGKRERRHRQTVDAVAACLLLEGFLAKKRR